MAINFPSSPSNGEEYTDPNSGTWVYDSGTNSWTLVAGGSTSAFNFRGGHDFRQSTPPAEPIESGDMWIHDAPNGTIDGVYTGISGQIANGQLVLWDGNSYVMVSGTLPGYPDVGDGEGGTLDSRYLKLGANAGAQTVATTETTFFQGITEHGGGVKVTGGSANGVVDGIFRSGSGVDLIQDSNTVIRLASAASYKLSIQPKVNGANTNLGYGCVFSPQITDSEFTTSTHALRAQPNLEGLTTPQLNYFSATYLNTNTKPVAVDRVYGFNVDASLNFGTVQNRGFSSDLPAQGDKNWNFYAAGTAPNYFKGEIVCANTPQGTAPGLNNTNTGCLLTVGGRLYGSHGTAPALNGNTNNPGKIISLRYQGAEVGSINTDGTNISVLGQASDYRIKEDVTPLNGASDIVKAIDVVNFKYTDRGNGEIHRGFIAHQLQEAGVPEAVWGTKDATETYGTYTDNDGNVETDVVEPAVIPSGASFVAEGTRDVYQGVDQTKLIPLLTKALQECLERIETLEAAATSSGY